MISQGRPVSFLGVLNGAVHQEAKPKHHPIRTGAAVTVLREILVTVSLKQQLPLRRNLSLPGWNKVCTPK